MGALSEDHVARARAVDDLFLLAAGGGVAAIEPALLPIGLGPQRIDPSRVVGGFYRSRVREREELFRDAESEQRVTELGVLSWCRRTRGMCVGIGGGIGETIVLANGEQAAA